MKVNEPPAVRSALIESLCRMVCMRRHISINLTHLVLI